jgi:hypothetical protein
MRAARTAHLIRRMRHLISYEFLNQVSFYFQLTVKTEHSPDECTKWYFCVRLYTQAVFTSFSAHWVGFMSLRLQPVPAFFSSTAWSAYAQRVQNAFRQSGAQTAWRAVLTCRIGLWGELIPATFFLFASFPCYLFFPLSFIFHSVLFLLLTKSKSAHSWPSCWYGQKC